jgi:hypothetical protein
MRQSSIQGAKTTGTKAVKNPRRKKTRITKRTKRVLVSMGILMDDKYVFDALQRLYNLQTDYEKQIEETEGKNYQGFNKSDAKRFTQMAETSFQRGYLTPEELAICRKQNKQGHPALSKYWRQLPRVLDEPWVIQTAKKPPAQSDPGNANEAGSLAA